MSWKVWKGTIPEFEYINKWGEYGTQWYLKAEIRLNGHVFLLRHTGKIYGYSGWYTAYLNGKKVSREYAKLDPLLRKLWADFPEVKNE